MQATPLDRIYARPLFRLAIGIGTPILAAIGVLMLSLDGSIRSRLLPPCIFRLVTGLYCPGCGTTRLLDSLLHGRIADAFGYNPLMFFLLPVVGYALLGEYLRILTGRSILPRIQDTQPAMIALLLAVVLFTIARNIALPGFSDLAP